MNRTITNNKQPLKKDKGSHNTKRQTPAKRIKKKNEKSQNHNKVNNVKTDPRQQSKSNRNKQPKIAL
jgi:hypothetical protein